MKKRLAEIKKELKTYKAHEEKMDRDGKLTDEILRTFNERKNVLIAEKEKIERLLGEI